MDKSNGDILIFSAPGKKSSVEVRLEKDTVWLSLAQMALLFERDKSVISRHLKNVFASRELIRKAVVAENATTAADGKTRFACCHPQRNGFSRGSTTGARLLLPGFDDLQCIAAIFLWFLERNTFLYRSDGAKRIADNALVALTIMIAASDPAEKEDIVRLTINLINRKN